MTYSGASESKVKTRLVDVERFLNDLIDLLQEDEKSNNRWWRFHIVTLENMRDSGSSLHKTWWDTWGPRDVELPVRPAYLEPPIEVHIETDAEFGARVSKLTQEEGA